MYKRILDEYEKEIGGLREKEVTPLEAICLVILIGLAIGGFVCWSSHLLYFTIACSLGFCIMACWLFCYRGKRRRKELSSIYEMCDIRALKLTQLLKESGAYNDKNINNLIHCVALNIPKKRKPVEKRLGALTVGAIMFSMSAIYGILTNGFSDKSKFQLLLIVLVTVIYFALASIPFKALAHKLAQLNKYVRLKQDLERVKIQYEEPKTFKIWTTEEEYHSFNLPSLG